MQLKYFFDIWKWRNTHRTNDSSMKIRKKIQDNRGKMQKIRESIPQLPELWAQFMVKKDSQKTNWIPSAPTGTIPWNCFWHQHSSTQHNKLFLYLIFGAFYSAPFKNGAPLHHFNEEFWTNETTNLACVF